jgi:CBS domain-containing protein/anti-sigma regulatory factor (Ser/Thr protein kinase)
MSAVSEKHSKPMTDQDAENITRTEELAYELKVDQVMTRDLKLLSPAQTMLDALECFREERISGAPVVSGGKLVGLISMEDLIRCLRKNDLQASVSEYMTTSPQAIRCTDPVVEALKQFAATRYGRFPVLNEKGELVGIITKGDLTRGILTALQHDYHEEEVRKYRASHLFEDINSDRTSLILRYNIKAHDFLHGGRASSDIKRALLRLGATPQIARRCGIAIYEAEMNLIIHTTSGGIIRVEIEPHRIIMKTVDDGPGIADIKLAMQAGYTTASQEVRELGFGAGMGLVNIQRCVDEMSLQSRPNQGTRLEMKIDLPPAESFREALTKPTEESQDEP